MFVRPGSPWCTRALVVVGPQAQVVVQLKRRIRTPNAIDARDVLDDVPRSIPVPDLVLVHLGVQVVLAACPARRAKCFRTARSHCRCRTPTRASRPAPGAGGRLNARRTAGLAAGYPAYWRRSYRGSTPSFRRLRQLGQVFLQLPLRVPPGEVRVALGEAELSRAARIIFGRVKASARKMTSG